jgi:hypothetical protein
MKPNRLHSSITNLLIAVMIFTGCAGGSGGGRQTTPTGTVSVALPFLPIEIAYDLLNNKIRVSISNKIQTPLGTFGFSAGVVLEERKYEAAVNKKYKSTRKLKIEFGDKLHVYKLEDGRQYNIRIPTDVDNNATIKTDGADGDITVSVPRPSPESIAELREEIRRLRIRLSERAQPTPQTQTQGSDGPSQDDPEPAGDATSTTTYPSPETLSEPPAAVPGRIASGIYEGSAGVADIRLSESGGFSFVLSTPHCSREAIGRANWSSSGLAYSVTPIREDAARLGSTEPIQSDCSLSFTFSGNVLTVGKVGEACHCNYSGLYSLR